MSDPLPLQDVLEIVERRRRRRARVQTAAGSALAVAGAGVAGLIVVVLQSGPADLVPAAAPVPTLPTVAALSAGPPPFDPGYLQPDYLGQLADSLFASASEAQAQRSVDDAATMAAAWDIELYPASKAVLAKAALTGTAVDPADPTGDDELVSRFEEAGYTDADAAELAAAWGTDTRTAKIVGALVAEAG